MQSILPFPTLNVVNHLSNPTFTLLNETPKKPEVQNVVSTVSLGCELDLKTIALKARNTEYKPKRFAALVMRIHEPRTTALIFKSGKIVVTGAKDEAASRLAARRYARIIQKLGYKVRFLDFKIQNILGSVDVGFRIRLEKFQFTDHSEFCNFEPELFPGLVYRMAKSKIVLLVFATGKLVITGAKTTQQIEDAFNNIYPVLKLCKFTPAN